MDKLFFKGMVSDSNNIFLWHELEDINKKKKKKKKKVISKISVDSNFTFASYAWLYALIICISITPLTTVLN